MALVVTVNHEVTVVANDLEEHAWKPNLTADNVQYKWWRNDILVFVKNLKEPWENLQRNCKGKRVHLQPGRYCHLIMLWSYATFQTEIWDYMLWTECLCPQPPQFIYCSHNLPCDGLWRWGLWEVTRVGWGYRVGPLWWDEYPETERHHMSTKKSSELGSVKVPELQYFVMGAWAN